MPNNVNVDYRRPFIYRVDPFSLHNTMAYVEVFQDHGDRRVNMTSAIVRHLMAMDKAGQNTGNFVGEQGTRLVASVDLEKSSVDPQRYERSTHFLLKLCADAVGLRRVSLSRDDSAEEGMLPHPKDSLSHSVRIRGNPDLLDDDISRKPDVRP